LFSFQYLKVSIYCKLTYIGIRFSTVHGTENFSDGEGYPFSPVLLYFTQHLLYMNSYGFISRSSRDSDIRLWVRCKRNRSSIPGRTKTGSDAHPASLPNGYRNIFPRG